MQQKWSVCMWVKCCLGWRSLSWSQLVAVWIKRSSWAAQYLSGGLKKVWNLRLLVHPFDVLCCEVLKFCWPNLSFVFWEGF